MADTALVFTLDGKRLEVNFEEITGRDAKEFRNQTGLAFRPTVLMFMQDPDSVDLDTIAGIIWLARRLAGDQVTYDTVLDETTYATEFLPEVVEVDPPEV